MVSDLDRLSKGVVDGTAEDGGGGDVGTRTDAGGSDATADGGGCDHTICEDFDDEASLTSWRLTRSGETLPLFGVDDRASTTPPSSFFYEASEPLSYGSVTSISKIVPVGAAGGIRCTFDLRIDAYDGSFLHVFALGIPNDASSPTIGLEAADDSFNIVEEPGGVTRRTEMTPPVGVWTKITVTFRRSPALDFTLSDGLRTVSIQPKTWRETNELYVSFGLVHSRFAVDGKKAAARFDTIRCDVL